MVLESTVSATQTEYEARRSQFLRQSFVYAAVSIVTDACCAVVAFIAALELFGDTPLGWGAGAVFMTLMTLPVTGFIAVHALQQEKVLDGLTAQRESALRAAVERADLESTRGQRQGQHQEFEARLLNALEMAENETEVLGVVQDAFAVTLPDAPVELLLADNSHAHLVPVATVEHDGQAPGCAVESPNQCPAARRAQIQRFPDSGALDACPKLRNRPNGACGAVCVPVSIMGRTVGVIHATGPVGWTVDEDDTGDLQTLAKQAGTRLGLLRIMAETQLQAETDGLTGLSNRRTMENQIHALRRRREPFALAMIDLDHFKQLNDSLGHETGDRALRFFAHTLPRLGTRTGSRCSVWRRGIRGDLPRHRVGRGGDDPRTGSRRAPLGPSDGGHAAGDRQLRRRRCRGRRVARRVVPPRRRPPVRSEARGPRSHSGGRRAGTRSRRVRARSGGPAALDATSACGLRARRRLALLGRVLLVDDDDRPVVGVDRRARVEALLGIAV